MVSCAFNYSWYSIQPLFSSLRLENYLVFFWVLVIVFGIALLILKKLGHSSANIDKAFKVAKILNLIFTLIILLLIVAFITSPIGPGTCPNPGNLSESILEQQVKDGYTELSAGDPENAYPMLSFMEAIILRPQGEFESSKFTFNCISNSQLDSLPDEYKTDLKSDGNKPFSFEVNPECSDFVKQNRISNDSEETYYLLFYRCITENDESAINTMLLPGKREYERFLMHLTTKTVLCDLPQQNKK